MRALLFVTAACLALTTVAVAQEEKLDDVSKQATELETQLGKLRDTSKEAGDVLLKLVDLYHSQGRIFGLIRSGEAFVNKHAARPEHKQVMLKLIDGLVAMSRNKETSAACRQFLQRYPEAPECATVELTLGRALEQLNDRPKAAESFAAVYQRAPKTADGIGAGLKAISLYSGLNNAPALKSAAELADAMFESLPAGEMATNVGLQSVQLWRRQTQWAKSNAIGAKLLARNQPAPPLEKRDLHANLADNFFNLGQRANGVDHLRKARALGDRQDYLYRMISELHAASSLLKEIEPLVGEYLKLYPDRPDRHLMRSYLAAAYLREKQKDQGLKLLVELLEVDAVANGNASLLVRENGSEPAQLAQTEKTLNEAIAKNPKQAAYLRFVLATELYRDRMKDNAKVRSTFEALVSQSPSNDSNTQQAIYWLLYNAADDKDFQAQVARVMKARAARLDFTLLRNSLNAWASEAGKNRDNKDLKARVQSLKAQLGPAEADQLAQDFAAGEAGENRGASATVKLLETNKQLSDEQYRFLAVRVGEYYRNYANTQQRSNSVDIYASAAKRLPKDQQIATYWLYAATDYAKPDVAKAAVEHMLKFEPTSNNSDLWRRLLQVPDQLKDPELVKKAFAWIQKSQEKYGADYGNAEGIGDVLERAGLKSEALAYWRRALAGDPNSNTYLFCAQRVVQRLELAERMKFLQEQFAKPADNHGAYAMLLAVEHLKVNDLDKFEKVMRDTRKRQDERPFRAWGVDEYVVQVWVDQLRGNKEADVAVKRRVYTLVRDLKFGRPSAAAELALLEVADEKTQKPLERMLAYQSVTLRVGDDTTDWDRLFPYAQAAMARKDYAASSTLVTAMLANIPNLDTGRKTLGRDMVGQSYARMGGVGLAIDESSPIAPLLQAALYLRLGDERLAFDTYSANKALFDAHRFELPVDLIIFVCDSHIAAGGEANFDRAEDILRSWLVRFSEAADIDANVKVSVQLLLARNYYKAQRYDVARTEFQTVINRFPKTPQATEAEFGIGESYMAQKVYDQAEQVFEKLINSPDRDIVIRAEFLRGVLANRRGDRDQAREIFKNVLDRVPSIELANQALFNLAEVYGAEERYVDQLELLRTVGRLGRTSKRLHAPGTALSIVVQDSDLGISRGHARIPVLVSTQPGGDQELIYLYSGGAGKGLFRADLDTRLGQVNKNDKVLQLTGKDVIRCDYPEEFKAEFKSVPLSDAEIRVAADATLRMAGNKIIDEDEETFSQRLEREAREEEASDQRRSLLRPADQIKPSNPLYVKVEDADRDLSDEADPLTVKLTATSGDQVQAKLVETGPHTGVFEGVAQTGELPAGALASDAAIDHSPLMAIDKDPASFWQSEPDGTAPKWLAVDMKDVKNVARVTFKARDAQQHVPVRGELQGSHDGRFWHRIASYPALPPADPVAGEFGQMTERVYSGSYTSYTDWKQVVDLTRNAKPIEEGPVDTLSWTRSPDSDDLKKPFAVVWHGKLVQQKAGAARLAVAGVVTALMIDGAVELPLGPANRTVDVWLERGTHDVAAFSALSSGVQVANVTWAKANLASGDVLTLQPLRAIDFDLQQSIAAPAKLPEATQVKVENGEWQFTLPPTELRHVRLFVREYLGEALAIANVEVAGPESEQVYIPTKADVLSLANNEILEIAAGDTITATYSDEFTQSITGRTQLLTARMSATYFDAGLRPIAYDFERTANGQVVQRSKRLMRVDPGDRVIVEVTDYDEDSTDKPDHVKVQVSVNDGPAIELLAQETEAYTGVFTKEIDTSATPDAKKLVIKPGDRIVCKYLDVQNRYPGHGVPRETVVYVNEPTQAQIRVVETRIQPAPKGSQAPPRITVLPAEKEKPISDVAFEAPLTVEVIDKDAAKDSGSRVTVKLTTTAGSKVEVNCVIPPNAVGTGRGQQEQFALEEGRFEGQIILQLGGADSPDLVPVTASMPRNLVGGPKLTEEETGTGESLVTRVLNLTGKDLVTATYRDERLPKGAPPADVAGQGRLISNGTLACTDRDYEREVEQLHVGEKLYLMVEDADRDLTDERDVAEVEVTSERGEKEILKLEETLAHSGVFTGSVLLKPSESPTAGNVGDVSLAVETYFGDKLRVRYVDKTASTDTGELEQVKELPVVVGTDGLIAAFSKQFSDEELAVETQFHIAESCFELFKSHKTLGRQEELRGDLENGRRVLREVMEDYPNPKYIPRISYLLGQFSQELQNWDEAITSYQMIVKQYPDSTLAADAQYKLAQCYEEAGDFDNALEAYVTLAATYPKSPLIANVMIRISDHFYKKENFEVAAQVGEKFLERFEGHEWAPRIAFRVGQCHFKAKEYQRAATAFDKFAKVFPDDGLCADSLFWAGESFRTNKNNPEAFRRYNRCRWEHPASEAAKYARGRLSLPEMLAQFEAEANLNE